MRLTRLVRIAVAAAVASVIVTEGWWLAEGYSDARACLNTLPALEDTGNIVVTNLDRSNAMPGLIEIDYRVTDDTGSRFAKLRCAFGDGLDGERHLLGVEFAGRPIGEAHLYFLERFWLGDSAAVRDGRTRLDNEVPPLPFLAAIIGRPHPSLIGILVCALLAMAVMAANRFTRHKRVN